MGKECVKREGNNLPLRERTVKGGDRKVREKMLEQSTATTEWSIFGNQEDCGLPGNPDFLLWPNALPTDVSFFSTMSRSEYLPAPSLNANTVIGPETDGLPDHTLALIL